MRTTMGMTGANMGHRGLRATAGVLALIAATTLAATPMTAAGAEAVQAAPNGAQYLSLGASAAYAFQENTSGSALAQITQAQNASSAAASPAPVAAPTGAPIANFQLASFQAPPAQPYLQQAVYVRPAVLTGPLPGRDPDVFGSKALQIRHSALDARWIHAIHSPAPTDPRWAEMVKTASRLPERERLARVNAWINHAITFQSDQDNYGVSDYWASARESLARGRGDCEDYAIAKLELLRASGVPASQLYLVVAKDLVRRADHALLLVRLSDGYWLLDSNADEVLSATEVADYRPVVTFSAAGGEWMHGYRQQPVFRVASAENLAPASAR